MRSLKRYLSERGLVLEFGNRITPEINDRVRLMAAAVEERNIKGVVNLMPTFRSLLVEYDPRAISPDLDVLAQMRPGRKVRFKKAGLKEAHWILREYADRLSNIETALIPCF